MRCKTDVSGHEDMQLCMQYSGSSISDPGGVEFRFQIATMNGIFYFLFFYLVVITGFTYTM